MTGSLRLSRLQLAPRTIPSIRSLSWSLVVCYAFCPARTRVFGVVQLRSGGVKGIDSDY